MPAAEDAAQTFARGLERFAQPGVEGLIEQQHAARVHQHFEPGIDVGLEWTLTQQVGAEPVDGADVRFFEMREGVGQTVAPRGVGGAGILALEVFAKTQLEFAGSLLGERHGDDLVNADAPRGQRRDDPRDERRGLAGAGCCLDDEGLVQGVANQIAIALVGQAE